MKTIYSKDLIYIKEGSTLKQAKECMEENRIRHLPVVNSENSVVAIISKHDLINSEKLNYLPVELFATRPVKTVAPTTPIHLVALTLLENKISCVLVKDENNSVLGIITTDDLLYEFYKLSKATTKKAQYDLIQGDVANDDAGNFLSRMRQVIF